MSAYIRRLEAEAAAERQARQAERERTAAEIGRERLAPLEQRLARLLATIPVDAQRSGLSLSVLQGSLRGRHRGNCHPGELGRALRKLGFKRERQWRSTASTEQATSASVAVEPVVTGFRALWYPPSSGIE
jgi:hypothetical protein